MEFVQVARLQNTSLKLMKLSIFDDATQQKLGIKKFISGEENVTVS
jgi:hypothetical protein